MSLIAKLLRRDEERILNDWLTEQTARRHELIRDVKEGPARAGVRAGSDGENA